MSIVLGLHAVDVGLNPGTAYGFPCTNRIDSDCNY